MKIRILSADDVRTALPMSKAIEAMRRAFGAFSAGEATVPLRSHIATSQGDTLFMPAYLHRSGDFAIKVVSVYDGNPEQQLPRINAAVLLLDPETGLPRAFMDGGSLTALRTGACGGLAADLLCRRDAHTVALFGAGVQARSQLEAVRCVRDIRHVNLMSHTRASAERLASEIADTPDAPTVHLAENTQEAVGDADLVITATTSSIPLFNGYDLKAGAHVTAIGSYKPEVREIDTFTVKHARIVVDSREAALAEAGDILIAGVEIDAELGEIVNGDQPGRQSDDELTLFKSVGVAVQDAAAAAAAMAEAETLGLGTLVDI